MNSYAVGYLLLNITDCGEYSPMATITTQVPQFQDTRKQIPRNSGNQTSSQPQNGNSAAATPQGVVNKAKKDENGNASPTDVAAGTCQVASTANKAQEFGSTAATFSKDAKEIMNGTQAGANGADRAHSLSSALFDAYQTTEGGKSSKSLGAVEKALIPLSLASNARGTKQAISDLKDGKLKDGAKGLLVNGGGIGSDGLGLAELGLKGTEKVAGSKAVQAAGKTEQFAAKAGGVASKAGKVAKVAGKASGVAGGAMAVAEGGFQAYDGFKEGDKAKAGRGAAKSIAGGMMLAGAATGNPVLAAAGGLTYAGVSIYENREAIGKAAKTGAKFVGNVAQDAVQTQVKAVKAVGGAVGDGAQKVGELADKAKDKAVDVVAAPVKSVGNAAKKIGGWFS